MTGILPINRNRAAVKKSTRKIARAVGNFFDDERVRVSGRVASAYFARLGKSDTDDTLEHLMTVADPDWVKIIKPVQDALDELTRDGGEIALAQISVSDQDVTDQVNLEAVADAKRRAAELVGKRYDENGELIDNPRAEYAISETTREGLRELLEKAITEGWSNDKVADEIEGSHLFSADRSMMIARTESAFADQRGNMIAYRKSGVVTGKRWLLSSVHDFDDECNDNAEAGVIGIDDLFPSGADSPPDHPNCACDIIPVTSKDDE